MFINCITLGQCFSSFFNLRYIK